MQKNEGVMQKNEGVKTRECKQKHMEQPQSSLRVSIRKVNWTLLVSGLYRVGEGGCSNVSKCVCVSV